jgi:hypothetical protein
MEHVKRDGLRILTGLENGTLSSSDVYNVIEKQDPLLVYFIIRYLREKYPPQQPTSQGVTQRLLELTSTYDSIAKDMKKAEKDSLREWFDDTYEMREFFSKPEAYVDMIVEKIEG